MIKLRSEDTVAINDVRNIIVKNPTECDNFGHLIGETVEIDGVKEKVTGVEHFAHNKPWRAGEMIGLRVTG